MAGRGTEDVTGKAMRLDSHEDIIAVFDIPANERDVSLLIENAFKNEHAEIAVRRWQRRLTVLLDEAFRPEAVSDQFGDGDDLDVVALREFDQVRHTRHRSVFLHDFADHSGGRQAGRGGEIDGCLRLACTYEHAAVP